MDVNIMRKTKKRYVNIKIKIKNIFNNYKKGFVYVSVVKNILIKINDVTLRRNFILISLILV